MDLRRLFRKPRAGTDPADLYARIVRQARHPAFYLSYGVADTVEGRFEMIALHAFLLLHRLKGEDSELGQGVFDVMFADMDRSLRELGVGDLAVPKRIRTMAESFYGRVSAYEAALASEGQGALEAALRRNVYAGGGEDQAMRLAAYARGAAAMLAAQPIIDPKTLAFPDPEAIPEVTP